MAENTEAEVEQSDFFGMCTKILIEIIQSPLNIALVVVIMLLLYKIFKRSNEPPVVPEKPLPKLKRDFTLEELKPHNGLGPDGRVLIAANGKVFDVTSSKKFYGPGGPYAAFAGRDASRNFAQFTLDACKDEYDDLSDLNSHEMDALREWELQLSEKYHYVGRLLKPGEKHSNPSDEEEEASSPEKTKKQ